MSLKSKTILNINITDFNIQTVRTHLIDIESTLEGNEYLRALNKDQKIILKHQILSEVQNYFKNYKGN